KNKCITMQAGRLDRRVSVTSGALAAECARPRAMPLVFGVGVFALNLHSRAGLCRILRAIFSQQGGAHRIEHLLDATPVLQGAFEDWNHNPRHIQATPPALVSEGQQVVGMLVSASAGTAVGSDAGLTHPGQRAFEGRPQREELLEEALL